MASILLYQRKDEEACECIKAADILNAKNMCYAYMTLVVFVSLHYILQKFTYTREFFSHHYFLTLLSIEASSVFVFQLITFVYFSDLAHGR